MAKTKTKSAGKDDGTITLTGMIVDYREAVPGFFLGTFEANIDGRRQVVKFVGGDLFVSVGHQAVIKGVWNHHPKYGSQFKVRHLHYGDAPLAGDGLQVWLLRHGAAKGIGPAKAARLVQHYGEDFGRALLEDPEDVARVGGVKLEWIMDLAGFWRANQLEIAGMSGMLELGLDMKQAKAVTEKFGPAARAMIDEKPYRLLEVDGIGFVTADAIALKVGVQKDDPARVRAGVLYQFQESVVGKGSTAGMAGELVEHAAKLLGLTDHVEDIERGVLELMEKRELEQIGGYVTTPFLRNCEQETMDFFRGLAGANPWFDAGEAKNAARRHYMAALESERFEFDEAQLAAVEMGLRRRGCVITGPAGSGKTTILRVLNRAYREAGAKVHLAAPTGKAAKRMEQSTGFPATTIHRMLAYNPAKGWGFNRFEKLPADVVIIDEASMLSTDLTWRVVQALKDSAVLVLVGDHHQLPPVDAGATLRDCTLHGLMPVQVLETSHRHAGDLLTNCNRVLAGVVMPTVKPEPGHEDERKRKHAWMIGDGMDAAATAAKIVDIYCRFAPERLGIDPQKELQVIVPMNKDNPLAAPRLNKLLQRAWHAAGPAMGRKPVIVPDWGERKNAGFVAGDRVIQTRNNYQIDVMNGHQGIVITPPAHGTHGAGMSVLFEDKEQPIQILPENVGDVSLSYALTAHKCQGSEWKAVVVACHSVNSFMLHRQWLYTACTRARETLMLVGDERGMGLAASRVEENKRVTMLGWMSKQETPRAGKAAG